MDKMIVLGKIIEPINQDDFKYFLKEEILYRQILVYQFGGYFFLMECWTTGIEKYNSISSIQTSKWRLIEYHLKNLHVE